MAELGVGFARDERGSRRRYRISGADRTASSREQYWPPRRSRPTRYNQSPSRAVLAKFPTTRVRTASGGWSQLTTSLHETEKASAASAAGAQ